MMGVGAEATLRDLGDLICWGAFLNTLAKELPYFRFYQFQKWAFQPSSPRIVSEIPLEAVKMSEDSHNWKKRICHDCNAKVGELHQLGCDMERCPSCLGQLISCGHYDEVETGNIPRIPYIPPFFHCAVCNEFFPDMFHVPDVEWDKYVIPTLKRKVLCRDCYDAMKELFPLGWRNMQSSNKTGGVDIPRGKVNGG